MLYIIQFARLKSTRVENKLLNKYCNETLIELGEDYIRDMVSTYDNVQAYVVCPMEDRQLFSLPTLIEDGPYSNWVEYMQVVKEATNPGDIVWHANIMCHPLMMYDIGSQIIETIQDKKFYRHPMVTVYEKRGSVWDSDLNKIYGTGLADTKNNEVYYEYAHHGYIIPYEYLHMSADKLAEWCKPLVLKDPSWRDKLDIDTYDDLEHLDSLQ